MKPNGRRRWRRRAKNLRHMLRHEWPLILEHATPKVRAQLLNAQKHHSSRPLLPLPAREFSARSLCGMSMGARKRAVLREMRREDHPLHGHRLDYWEVRAKYRLGERLRPCKGKNGCRNCSRTCGACEDQIPNDTRCRRCGSMMTTEGPFCDGSGVLPARRHRRCGWWLQTRTAKNATDRCGMPMADGWLDCQNCGGSGWLMGRERP